MKRKHGWFVGGLLIAGMLLGSATLQAEGVEDFTLLKAIPGDAMVAAASRGHEGLSFLDKQYERVWAAVEKQHFERDLKRAFKGWGEQSGVDAEHIEERWQQFSDLLATVEWSSLCERECAFGMKIAAPMGAEFVLLMQPPKDKVVESFDGLTAAFEAIVKLDEQGMLQHTVDGEGAKAVHKLGMANMPLPIGLTLARNDEVLLLGLGTTMPEQSLALLRGEMDAKEASLVGTPRFTKAIGKLDAPRDSLTFGDIAAIMEQVRVFAKMATAMQAAPGDEAAENPMAFVEPLINELDVCDYAVSACSTDGMKTMTEELTVFKASGLKKTMVKAFFDGKPLKDPLKYVPVEATSVTASSGIDFRVLYDGVRKFIENHAPDGKLMLEQFDATQEQSPIKLEENLLSWLGSEFVTFSAPIPSPFMPSSVAIIEVKDEEKAKESLAMLSAMANAMLAQQDAGVEPVEIEGLEGFQQVKMPAAAMMIPGLKAPTFGVKDGRLFIATEPKVLELVMQTASGSHDNFSKNEQYIKEGMPVQPGITGFSFSDLSNWGQETSEMLGLVGMAPMFMPEVASDPGLMALVGMVSKFSKVVKEFNFYSSSCKLSKFDRNHVHSRTVTTYREPPEKKSRRRASKPKKSE